ncbi:LysM peptidoglycan-binding domain-containing protein [Schumannella luteola]|jgi:hypothetical protein
MTTAIFGASGYEPLSSRATVRPVAGQPRLRLTRRGRAVLLALAAAPLVVAAFFFTLNGGGATASLDDANVTFAYVTVDAGQSLWQLAESIAPTADPREVIDAIVAFNNLASADVYAGQELAIPVQYLP